MKSPILDGPSIKSLSFHNYNIPPLLSTDFEFLMWYYPLVFYYMKSKNTVSDAQASYGEHLWYGILPNKHCMIVNNSVNDRTP
jgi:hypothetical protein